MIELEVVKMSAKALPGLSEVGTGGYIRLVVLGDARTEVTITSKEELEELILDLVSAGAQAWK